VLIDSKQSGLTIGLEYHLDLRLHGHVRFHLGSVARVLLAIKIKLVVTVNTV
jgi:hypothetical protein